jgi:hypothetical protein
MKRCISRAPVLVHSQHSGCSGHKADVVFKIIELEKMGIVASIQL